jgi:large subunit ribosomal protein L18
MKIKRQNSSKKQTRLKRALKTRAQIKLVRAVRLCVHRSSSHIYAQVIAVSGDKILASASSLEKEVAKELSHGGNVIAAKAVGKMIATRAIKAGIKEVAFDRSGFHYHGRIKALAEAARETGLVF